MDMDVWDATSTTSMDVVKVGLENPVGFELGEILYWKMIFFWKPALAEKFLLSFFEIWQEKPVDGRFLFMNDAKSRKS